MKTNDKSRRLAIATITIGAKFEKMATYTHPLIRNYADKCNADFIVLNEKKMYEKCGLATYERFQLYEWLDRYDRIAFIDTDIVVAPDSPNVFELVPEDKLGVANEERYSKAGRDREVTQEVLGKVDWQNVYFNAGMLVLSKAHKELLNPDEPKLPMWAKGDFRAKHVNLLNDQPYLNHRSNLLGIKVHDLGVQFNHTRAIAETHTRFRSYFIHYSGPSGHRYGDRLEQIRKDCEIMSSPIQLSISRRVPRVRWLIDRSNVDFLKYLFAKLKLK